MKINNANLFIKDSALLTWGMRFLDALILTSVGIAVYIYRFGDLGLTLNYKLAFIISFLLAIVMFPMFGIYDSWRGKSVFQQFHRVIGACITVFVALVLISVALKNTNYFSRIWFGAWSISGPLTLIVYRRILFSVLRFFRQRGWNLKNVFVVGPKDFNERLHERLKTAEWTGFRIKGSFETVGPEGECADHAFINRLHEEDIHEVWVTYSLRDSERVNQLLYVTRNSPGIRFRYIPDISDFQLLLNNSVSEIAGIVTLDLNHSPLEGLNALVKEIEDRVLAAFILVFISPLLGLIALAIRLESRGPVLFKQARHGWGGKPINVYKFRSMIWEKNADFVQATRNDARVTRVGAFLRRTSLDELPQFYNVLQGRMSIVGPRPHPIALNKQYMDLVDNYFTRNKVKPGITGWAQVNGWRGETDTLNKMEKRVEYDLYYIRNWSLWLDLKIIFLTFFRLVGKNVY